MRTLFLMRHAATEASHAGGDKARELTPHGRRQATEVGLELRDRGVQLVLASAATRVRQTVACLQLGAEVEYMEALYNCEPDTLVQRIGEVPDEVTTLLVVGHSPAVPALSANLVSTSSRDQADDLLCSYPTATLSEFTLTGSWTDLLRDESLRLAGVRRGGF